MSLREMLEEARRGGYAVPLFDTQNMAMIRSECRGGEFAGHHRRRRIRLREGDQLAYWMALANSTAIGAKVPVCIMLDQGASLNFACAVRMRALPAS
ncbi:MAG: hypothetical protein V8T86_10780 [Victivallis sp.]